MMISSGLECFQEKWRPVFSLEMRKNALSGVR